MNRTKKYVVLVVAIMFALSTTLFANDQITMTSAQSTITIYTNKDATNISIDWGDGVTSNSDEGKRHKYGVVFSHQYSDTNSHTIVIRATNFNRLYCSDNQLSSLNVSGCTALTTLNCGNNQLTGLDVSKNTALTYLDCHYNRLTNLDVSKNTALTVLYCSVNQLTTLNVSECTALTRLWCGNNQLTSLDVIGCAALAILDCYRNQLTSLNVSTCTKLKTLDVSYCRLLTRLYCNYDKV
ncbi:MAG: leucine-rich repeat domain-containing protein, partial [Bacteroidales bacterium]|nr:leucine-rich repeat domain-containing protein [Bacteroidales bacterium]